DAALRSATRSPGRKRWHEPKQDEEASKESQEEKPNSVLSLGNPRDDSDWEHQPKGHEQDCLRRTTAVARNQEWQQIGASRRIAMGCNDPPQCLDDLQA